MKPLENLFEAQASVRSARGTTNLVEERDVFIYFETTGGAYAVPVTCVREIADSYTLTPYPEAVSGHIGITSLRGQVLPVISPRLASESRSLSSAAEQIKNAKLLILEFGAAVFCLPVQKVRKVLVSRAEQSASAVINVHGRPVRVIGETDLIEKSEVA